MIKCNDVKVCAVISRAASEKTGKDGTKFLSFSVKPTITAYNGESKSSTSMSPSMAIGVECQSLPSENVYR